ncbi:dickkopf-related protein 3 [Ciona intestinalis]
MKRLVVFSFILLVNFCSGMYRYRLGGDLDRQLSPYTIENDANDREDEQREDMLYKYMMEQLIHDIGKENDFENELEDNDSPPSALEELTRLENTIDDLDKDGRWVDDVEELENEFPPNYHNVTEFRTKIGNQSVHVKESIDKNTLGNEGQSEWLSEEITSKSDVKRNRGPRKCSAAFPCAEDEYCFETQTSSECKECKLEEDQCVDNAECCQEPHANYDHQAMCVFGRCKLSTRPGALGTICEVPDDCDAGLCCADTPGYARSLCKPYARIGERCSIEPDYNPSEYIVLEDGQYFCPCESDLTCVSRGTNNEDNLQDYNTPQFCEMPRLNIDRAGTEDKVQIERDLLAKLFPELVVPHWQQRMETIEDQQFTSNMNPSLHKTTKKAMEENDLIM